MKAEAQKRTRSATEKPKILARNRREMREKEMEEEEDIIINGEGGVASI